MKRLGTVHGVVVVDKPQGPTSHDVVRIARKRLSTRQIGHTGTLDPMATGVLVLAVGDGTKLVSRLTADDKSYAATIRHSMVLCRLGFRIQIAHGRSAIFSSRRAVADRGRSR